MTDLERAIIAAAEAYWAAPAGGTEARDASHIAFLHALETLSPEVVEAMTHALAKSARVKIVDKKDFELYSGDALAAWRAGIAAIIKSGW